MPSERDLRACGGVGAEIVVHEPVTIDDRSTMPFAYDRMRSALIAQLRVIGRTLKRALVEFELSGASVRLITGSRATN